MLDVTDVRTASGAHPASNRVGEAARQVIVRTRLRLVLLRGSVPRSPATPTLFDETAGAPHARAIGCPR
ncbi:MAG: hypothetical protein M3680_21210 [Myxococcota bacterium]|nr:hypothetical protein [Myxococcota bacterium]